MGVREARARAGRTGETTVAGECPTRGVREGMRAYVGRVWAEVALVVVLASCLATVVLQGFVVAPTLQFNYLLTGCVSLVLQATLFWAAAAWRWRIPGGAAFFVLAVALVAHAMATSTAPDPLADVEGNKLAWALVLVVANLGAFALSRARAGVVVLLAITLFACGFVEYVYHAGLVVPTLVALSCTAALLVVHSYARVEARGDAMGRPCYGWVALTGVVLAAGALALGVAVWAALIAPLDPGHVTIKLFFERRALPTEYVANPLVIDEVEDPDALSTNLGDTTVYGSQSVQIDSDDPALASLNDFIEQAREQAGSQGVYNPGVASDDGVYLYTYAVPSWWWLLLLPIPVVLVVLAVLARKLVRRHRRRRLARQAPREQVAGIYVDVTRRLGKLGLGRPTEQTPAEFARDAAERLEVFWAWAPEVSWDEVSAAYERAHYGAIDPDEDELACCWAAWDSLPRCALRRVGRLRYAFHWFWVL